MPAVYVKCQETGICSLRVVKDKGIKGMYQVLLFRVAMSFPQAYREAPFWRKENPMSTSEMLTHIQDFVERYEGLEDDKKELIHRVFEGEAMTEFLYQVNHIEGEGFSTLKKTQEAISKGALELDADQVSSADDRLKAVNCLHRALRHWYKPGGGTQVPQLDESTLLQSHQSLLGPVWPKIAGRFRNRSEVVYVQRLNGSEHYFVSPERVRPDLSKLIHKANKELKKIFSLKNKSQRMEELFKFAGRFFFEYECIHPFVDGNGRTGRIMLAYILQSVTGVFPNVLFVDKLVFGRDDPPFVDEDHYTRCFEMAHDSVDEVPRDLTALVIEGVYVGWKRLFHAIDSQNPQKNTKG